MCALRDRPRVWSERPESGATIGVIAEAPGAAEESLGRPLIGPAGRLWHAVLANENVQLDRSGLWIANAICCRPPENKIDSFEGADALTCCAAGLRQELAAMRAAGVKVVVAMGTTAQKALGVAGRGTVVERDGLVFVSTHHPAFVLRGGGARKEGSREPLAALIADWRKARDIARDGWHPPRERFTLSPTLDDLAKFVNEACSRKALLGVDTETTGLSPWRGARVVVCGFALDTERALVVPFQKEHGFPYWKNGDDAKARALVQRLFDECPLVFQNAFFDVPMLRVAEHFRIRDDAIAHDTLVLHSLIAPEEAHNLEYIVSTYGATQPWKAWFRDRSKPIGEIDQIEMRRYNARDCVVLHQVLKPMLVQLDALDLRSFYETETRRLIAPIMQMTEAGVGFNRERLGAFTKLIAKRVEEARNALYAEFDIPHALKLTSDEELRYFLFGVRTAKFDALRGTLVTYKKHLKSGDKLATKFFQGERPAACAHGLDAGDVVSVAEARSLDVKREGSDAYAELVRLDTVERTCGPRYTLAGWEPLKTDTKKLSVGKEALLAYKIQLLNRLDTIAKLARPELKAAETDAIQGVVDFLDALQALSELEKLQSSFTTYGPDPDNRIRASWKMHGTSTGRLSCIARGELIQTERGLIPIEAITQGDRVLTHSGEYRTVYAKLLQGKRECVRLTFASGHHIICTIDHRLLTPQGWKRADELKEAYCVRGAEDHQRQEARREGIISVLRRYTQARHARYCQRVWNDRTQYNGNYKSACAPGASNWRTHLAAFARKIRQELVNVRKDWRTTSKLEGYLFRQQGTFHSEGRKETLFRTSNRVCESSWSSCVEVASKTHGAPYRRESSKQQSRQSRALHEGGASHLTPEVAKLASFAYVGEMEVYDLSVEVDHSFVAGGVVVKNCSTPNLEQLPQRGEGLEVRRFFHAAPGCKLVSSDGENLEVALLGFDSLDPVIIDIYENKKNIHDMNTRIIYGIDETHAYWGEGRKAAKIFQFGGRSYGGGDRTIHRKMLVAAPHLPLTFAQYVEAAERWTAAHPAYATWRAAVEEEVLRNRVVRNAFGRVRIFLGRPGDIKREAMNFRIQSAGACLINRAMIRLYERLRATGSSARFVLQVHDQLILEAPEAEAAQVGAWLREEIERPFEMHGFTRRVRADLTIGDTYADV